MIEQILNQIYSVVDSFASSTYGNLAGEIGALVVILGGVSFLILTINMILQIVPMHGAAVFGWAVKFILVSSAASSWAFFQPIYAALNGLADGVAGLLLGGNDMASGLDNLTEKLWSNADTLMELAGLKNLGAALSGALVALLAVALSCVSVVVIGISKIGLGIALGLAPLFIISLLFKATSDMFASWTKWTMTFVLNMIMVAGILGVMSNLLDMVAASGDAANLEDMIPAIIICAALVFFVKQVPSYAGALAGSMAMGGMSLTSAASKMGGGAASAAKGTSGAANNAYTAAKVGGAVMGAGREEKARGGSMKDRGSAMLAEYTDIHNKARATKNARLRSAASENNKSRSARGAK